MAPIAPLRVETAEVARPATVRPLRPGAAAERPVPTRQEPDARERALIERLRRLACRSRLARRLDLDKACALIAGEPGEAVDRYGVALLAALAETAACRLVFHPAGAAETTFAERWLLGLVAAIEREDGPSVRFQVERVVTPAGRRTVRFLATGLADALARLERG